METPKNRAELARFLGDYIGSSEATESANLIEGVAFLNRLQEMDLAIVPREPTLAMQEAGCDGHYGDSARDVWEEMLAACPYERDHPQP